MRRSSLIAAALLAFYFALAVGASWRAAPAFDETAHLAAGYNQWLRHDFRFDPANGDFAKRYATLPLLVTRPAFPQVSDPLWRQAEFFSVGFEMLYRLGNDPGAILFPCRCMIALLGVALGAWVFACAREIFGEAGGVVAVALYAMGPNLIAYGGVVTTDLATALGFFAATWCLWRLLHELTSRRTLASVAATAFLVTSKLSAVLLFPIAALLVAARLSVVDATPSSRFLLLRPKGAACPRRSLLLRLLPLGALHVLVAWAAIWALYDFRFAARVDATDPGVTFTATAAHADSPQGMAAAALGFAQARRLLPEGYLEGARAMLASSSRRPLYFNGSWSAGGRFGFFPYALLAKMPLAAWVLLLLAVPAWCRSRQVRYESFPFAALIAVYGGAAVAQRMDLGIRHLLPIFPALWVLAGGAAAGWAERPRWLRAAIAACVLVFAADSLSQWPHALSYFSPVVGGPSRAYQHLVDSSVDWGQDLPALRGTPNLFLAYFGTGDPDSYGVHAARLPGFPEWRELSVFAYTPGTYAISATLFQDVYTQPFGPWNVVFEAEYQRIVRDLRLDEANASDTGRLGAAIQRLPFEQWQAEYSRWEKLRFIRLTGFLRATHRAPDAFAGHSILLWHLDAPTLREALWGRPRELYPMVSGAIQRD